MLKFISSLNDTFTLKTRSLDNNTAIIPSRKLTDSQVRAHDENKVTARLRDPRNMRSKVATLLASLSFRSRNIRSTVFENRNLLTVEFEFWTRPILKNRPCLTRISSRSRVPKFPPLTARPLFLNSPYFLSTRRQSWQHRHL